MSSLITTRQWIIMLYKQSINVVTEDAGLHTAICRSKEMFTVNCYRRSFLFRRAAALAHLTKLRL